MADPKKAELDSDEDVDKDEDEDGDLSDRSKRDEEFEEDAEDRLGYEADELFEGKKPKDGKKAVSADESEALKDLFTDAGAAINSALTILRDAGRYDNNAAALSKTEPVGGN